MNTKPIFDYVHEIQNQRRFVFPREMLSADEESQARILRDYFFLLKMMEEEYEACVFQCVAEDLQFKGELHVVADKLWSMSRGWRQKAKLNRFGRYPHGDARRLAMQSAEVALRFLKENYGIKPNMADAPSEGNASVTSSVAPHFKGLSITVEQASKLYDKLVPSRLEDTGKSDFIYYFTGKGKQPSNKLIWKGDAIFLSNIMSILSPNRIPWKQMDTIFEGLNTDSMKSNLTKSKDSTAFKSDKRMIEAWLKTDSASIIKSMSAL